MDDKKQGQIIIDQPGMTHVVTKEYLQIWGTDVMIHRKFFLYYTIAAWILFQVIWGFILGSEAVAVFYYTLALIAWNFHLAHPVMFAVDAVAVIALIGIVWYNRRRYRQKHTTLQEQIRLQQLRNEAYGGELSEYG